MNLQLAVAASCTDRACQVQWLNTNVLIEADYAEPILDYGIIINPGDLVAIETTSTPVKVVYRLPFAVKKVEDHRIVTTDGTILDVERLQTDFFPEIRTMYQQLALWQALDPKQVVAEGYDRMAERYLQWVQTIRLEERERYTAVLLDELPPGAKVLDLGCGPGVPSTRKLAHRFQVTGVDLSAEQVTLAQQHVPEAQFMRADITQLDFAPSNFDGIAAFYSIIHVPREEQPELVQKMASWLRPGGLVVATMGVHSIESDFAEDWLGVRMYWSSFDRRTNEQLFEEAGLRVVSAREETTAEFGEPVTFLWIVAQKVVDVG